MYLKLIILFATTSWVCSVKTKPRKRANNPPRNIDENADPATLALADWQTMPLEALRLHCNSAHLVSSGSRLVLAERLHQFYNPPVSSSSLVPAVSSASSTSSAQQTVTYVTSSPADVQSDSNSVQHVVPPSSQFDIATLVQAELRRYFASNNIPSTIDSSVSQQPTSSVNNRTGLPIVSSSIDIPGLVLPVTSHLRQERNQHRQSNQPFADSMPPLPQAVIDKIQNGEFVNFDLLLPNRSPVLNDEYTFKVMGGSSPSVSLVPKNQRKPKVTDFNSWMVAWNNFLRCFGLFFPAKVSQLIRHYYRLCFTVYFPGLVAVRYNVSLPAGI